MNRIQKAASQIRHAICQIIERQLKDPRLGFITITEVQVSADLKAAKIYFTVLGNEKQKKDSEKALQSAVGFIRIQLGKYIRLRHVPELNFQPDESFEYGQKIEDLFKKINEGKASVNGKRQSTQLPSHHRGEGKGEGVG